MVFVVLYSILYLKNCFIKLFYVLKIFMFYLNIECMCIFFKFWEYYNKFVNNLIKIERG